MDSRSAPAPFGNTFAITNMTSGKKSDDFDPAAWAQDVGRTGLDVAMREAEAQSSVRARELVAPPPYPREPDHTEDGIDILAIPDSHARPGPDGAPPDNRRYEWLGRFAADHRPDVIVDLGDWWDLHALNTYDGKGSRGFQGASYWRDIDAGIDARLRFQAQIDNHNRSRRKSDRYNPRKVFCLGNHENRITRFLNEEPRFEGIVGLQDLQSKELGWEQIPFLQPVEIAGIAFAHYHVSGVRSMPVGGLHQAASLVHKQLKSCVMGHTHTADFSIRGGPDHVFGLVVGVYTEDRFDYAGPANDLWWRGACLLRNCRNGVYDLEMWSMDRIKALYG